MSKPIDFEKHREALAHKRKDARAAELKNALRQAREGGDAAGKPGQSAATRKLLDLYRKGKPRKP